MVARKRSRGKPRQIYEKDITDLYVWYDDSGKQSGGGQASVSQRHLGSDVLTRICSEKKKISVIIRGNHLCSRMGLAKSHMAAICTDLQRKLKHLFFFFHVLVQGSVFRCTAALFKSIGVHEKLPIYPLCGIFYFPWHIHQIYTALTSSRPGPKPLNVKVPVKGTDGFYCLLRKTLAKRG